MLYLKSIYQGEQSALLLLSIFLNFYRANRLATAQFMKETILMYLKLCSIINRLYPRYDGASIIHILLLSIGFIFYIILELSPFLHSLLIMIVKLLLIIKNLVNIGFLVCFWSFLINKIRYRWNIKIRIYL